MCKSILILVCFNRECRYLHGFLRTIFDKGNRAKPVHYDVSLFDMQLGDSWGYKGIVKIDSKITRSTKELVLNSKEIEVQKAEIFEKDGPSRCNLLKKQFLDIRLNY